MNRHNREDFSNHAKIRKTSFYISELVGLSWRNNLREDNIFYFIVLFNDFFVHLYLKSESRSGSVVFSFIKKGTRNDAFSGNEVATNPLVKWETVFSHR